MVKTYSGLVHLNGSPLAAVDLETTGRRAEYHEIIQIAVVLLNSDLRPLEGVKPFYHNVRPEHPERQETQAGYVHGIDINELVLHAPPKGRVQDLLREWFNRLDLPFGKNLVPLAHNWAFESSFLKAWWGIEDTDRIFSPVARDSMITANMMNDRSAFKGEKAPFNAVNLPYLAHHFGIPHERAHDALNDCITEAEVYRSLLLMDLL